MGIIADRGLQPGDRLPTSSELADMSGYSLISVRRALDELERAGRVSRRQGVGTFVAQSRIVAEPARSGQLLDTLGGAGDRDSLTTQLLAMRPALPNPTVASLLRTPPGMPVWEIVRRRMLSGRPVILETARIPIQIAPVLDQEWLAAGKSLYGLLSTTYGLFDQHEEQLLEVCTADAFQRAQLELPTKESVVRIRGVSSTEDGTPFDCFEQVYPAAQFAFFVSGTQQKHLLPAHQAGEWGTTALA